MTDSSKNAIITIDDLKSIWVLIIKNWYIPLLFGLLGFIIGYFYTYKLTNVYEVSSQILLNTKDQFFASNVISEGFGGGYQQDYNMQFVDNSNEMKVIKSYDLIRDVVKKLEKKMLVSYYIVGRIRTTEQFSGMPFEVSFTSVNPKLYNNPIGLKILDKDNIELFFKNNGEDRIIKGVFGKEIIDLGFNLKIERTGFNKNYFKNFENIHYEFIIHPLNEIVQQYQNSLQLTNPDYTNVIELRQQDIIPERAKLFLDTLASIYIQNSLKNRYDLNERTLLFIDKQMDEVLVFDADQYKDCYVKVVIKNKTNPFWFDNVIDRLEKSGAADLQVVEDHFHLDLEEDSDIVSEAEDTMSIVRKYITSMGINTDKKRVENIIQNLSIEAHDIL